MAYTKIGKHTVNAVRFVEIVQVFVRHGFADLVQRAGLHKGWPGKLLRGMRLMREPLGEAATFGSRLRSALTELGPTFVKLGQVLSTRPDLVGHKIAEELTGLQDEVTPVPFERMRPVIERELQAPLEALFASIEHVPVASASLSQVYRAVLKDGNIVAVKVQRPNIEGVIESDISLMETVAEWIKEYLDEQRIIDPPGIVEEFARSIRRELDFEVEARIAQQFADNFADDPCVVIPQPYPGHCSRHVLTLEWIEGVPVDTLEAYGQRNSDPAEIARIGCQALCKMVFEHRLFHADPHPGNIFLLRDNRLAFLDLGMSGHLESGDVQAMTELFLAIFNADSEACLEALLQLSSNDEPTNRALLAHEIAEYIAFEARVIVAGGQIARGIELAVQIMRRHNLELAPRFSLLLKALATIEIVGKQLDPQMDMTPVIQPYIETLITSRYSPAQLLKEIRVHANGYLRLSRQAPGDIAHLLRQLRSGRMKVHIHHEHLDKMANTMDRASKRNAVAVVTAALIVGSSLLISTNTPLAKLGIFGYVTAGLLGIFLIISILWGKEY
ncbi:MAG TPA: AarF/ABC1/UbiB kinase family protein [Candidatus Hydrogenedentes bacterium]|nr:AarF/ABC1/UbiB kinase family protein [Candidatus Hydrogenedentota bacterium]